MVDVQLTGAQVKKKFCSSSLDTYLDLYLINLIVLWYSNESIDFHFCLFISFVRKNVTNTISHYWIILNRWI